MANTTYGPTTMGMPRAQEAAPQPPPQPTPPPQPPVGRPNAMPQGDVGQRPQSYLDGAPRPQMPQYTPWQNPWMNMMPTQPAQNSPWQNMGQWPQQPMPAAPWSQMGTFPSMGQFQGWGAAEQMWQPPMQQTSPWGVPSGWLMGQMLQQPGYGPPIMGPQGYPEDGRAIDGGPMPNPPPQQGNPWAPQPQWQAPWYGQGAF